MSLKELKELKTYQNLILFFQKTSAKSLKIKAEKLKTRIHLHKDLIVSICFERVFHNFPIARWSDRISQPQDLFDQSVIVNSAKKNQGSGGRIVDQ